MRRAPTSICWIRVAACAVVALSGLACVSEADSESRTDATYEEQIRSWHREREARLKQPDGWLSLAGLYWLEDGANAFGSDPAGDLVFPADGAQHKMGTLVLDGGRVTLQPAAGVELVLSDGTRVSGPTPLDSDAAGEPTVVTHDTLSFYLIERDGRLGVRLKDSASPVRTGFTGIETFPVDPAWRVTARFERFDRPKLLRVPTVLDTELEESVEGALVFSLAGEEHRLDPLREGDRLFIIFGDVTNGHETYGGGRYLYAELPGSDGTVSLDFNKAYNPPCVFTPYATCPLPPAGNRLPVRVEAGEKLYRGPGGHQVGG